MKIQAIKSNWNEVECDALAVPLFEDEDSTSGFPAELDRTLKGLLGELRDTQEWKAKSGEITLLHRPGGMKASRLILLGAGKKEKYDTSAIRNILTQAFDLDKWRALRGEYMTGKQAPSAGTTRTESFDVKGWYFYAIQNLGTRHQFVVRVDEYDPDTDRGNNAILTINPAYVFHWDEHSKVMLSYEMPDTEGSDPDDNVFTLRYQFSF